MLVAQVSAQHAFSASDALVTIDRRSVRLIVRLPLDEVDLLLRLDRDLDGEVSATELEASRPAILAYLTKHLHVDADGSPLRLSLEHVGPWGDAAARRYVEVAAVGRTATRMARVSIRSDFLTELDSAHQTQARIRIRDRVEEFVFRPGATFERRLAADRLTSTLLLLAGCLVIGALWFARRRTATLSAAVLAIACLAAIVHADVILSAPRLNAALKTMERLAKEGGPEATFKIGLEADALASLMNQEVESHGMQERELLDLALGRTKELGVGIAYNREKKKFFYDGAAFRQYLKDAPRDTHAAAAEFMLLSYEFYQSAATDVAAVTAAAESKKRFLARYPTFSENVELRLYLAVDYRDLSRRYRDAGDSVNAARYQRLSRAECERILRMYPGSEQAGAARRILRSSR